MIESKKIKLEDFQNVSKNNQYWLWHLTLPKPNDFLEIQPLDEEPNEDIGYHVFREIVSQTKIPVFQTKMIEVVDFVLYLDNKILEAFKNKKQDELGALILGFNHSKLVDHTINRCYCSEGVINILLSLNPKLLSNFGEN